MVFSWDLPRRVYFLESDLEKYTENFSTGAFTTGWATVGDADWYIASNDKFGNSAPGAQSGDIADSQTSTLTYTGNCRVWNFTMFVSAENINDKVEFLVDGTKQNLNLVNSAFVQVRGGVATSSAETHTFQWTFMKDFSVTQNDDTAYLKEFSCTKLLEYSSPLYDTTSFTTFQLNYPLNLTGVYTSTIAGPSDSFMVDIYPNQISADSWNRETTVNATTGSTSKTFPFGVYTTTDPLPFFESTVPATTALTLVETVGYFGSDGQVIFRSPCVYGVDRDIEVSVTGIKTDVIQSMAVQYDTCGFKVVIQSFSNDDFLSPVTVNGVANLTSASGTVLADFSIVITPTQPSQFDDIVTTTLAVIAVAVVVLGIAVAVMYMVMPTKTDCFLNSMKFECFDEVPQTKVVVVQVKEAAVAAWDSSLELQELIDVASVYLTQVLQGFELTGIEKTL